MESKIWDRPLIDALLPHDEADVVYKVPLLPSIHQDFITWWPSKDGIYSVKSAYYLCLNKMIDTSHLIKEGGWRKIWKLKIPPRVKTFIWQLCRGCLPSREKLQARGIPCPISCVMCAQDVEHYSHMFFTCPKSMNLWLEEGFWQLINALIPTATSFEEVIWSVFDTMSEDKVQHWCMLLWSLWRGRNLKLWEEKTETLNQIRMRASSTLRHWQWAQDIHKTQPTIFVGSSAGTTAALRWKAPRFGYYKCNIDASFVDDNKVGLGLCIRDHEGHFVKARTLHFSPKLLTHEGEALGLLAAVHWMGELNIDKVIFELDAKYVVDNFNSVKEDNSVFGAIMKDCKISFRSLCPNSLIEFTRRDANVVAHTLARVATNTSSSRDYADIPICIENFIMNEMNSFSPVKKPPGMFISIV